jgi:peptide/nickel transport system ATP-binding protein
MLNISNLTVQYVTGDHKTTALENVNFEIAERGYTVGIVGESGSGKTTLGMSIMNMIEPPGKILSGQVEYMGRNILKMSKEELRNYRWQEVSMVYQSAMNSLNPVKSVSEHITEVIRGHSTVSKAEAQERALRLLSHVGIRSDRANDYPHQFSGGMKQRAVIAMALALSPKLLIADEPTSALDVVVQKQILTLLKKQVMQEKLSMIFITHDVTILEGLVDNIVVLHDSRIVEYGPTEKILYQPSESYTKMLLSSILTLDSDRSTVFGRPLGE